MDTTIDDFYLSMAYEDNSKPILYAAKQYLDIGIIDYLRLLIDQGVEIPSLMLIRSSSDGNDEVMKLLLDYGLDPNKEDLNTCTPLVYLVLLGNLPMIKMFIEYGADISSLWNNMYSDMIRERIYRYSEIYQFLSGLGYK